MTTATTQAPAAPVPGSPEYDAAMVAKADAKVETPGTPPASAPAPAPTGDALILGKFKTQADLEAAYKALESKLGTPPASKPADLKAEPSAEVQDVITKAGLQQADLEAAFAKDGKLTDEQYTALQGVGIPKAMVDGYLNGVAAQGQQFVGKVHAIVGGEAEFNQVITWAKANASPDQLRAYNDAIDKGDLGAISLALTAFKGGHSNANPVKLGGTASAPSTGFRSQAEMNVAIQDPRYRKDEAYRQDVYNKIAASAF